MKTFRLTVATPDGAAFSADVAMLTLRGAEGDLAVLAGHIPFVTTVKEGPVKIVFEDGNEKAGTLKNGILTVSESETTLLTSSFIWSQEE